MKQKAFLTNPISPHEWKNSLEIIDSMMVCLIRKIEK